MLISSINSSMMLSNDAPYKQFDRRISHISDSDYLSPTSSTSTSATTNASEAKFEDIRLTSPDKPDYQAIDMFPRSPPDSSSVGIMPTLDEIRQSRHLAYDKHIGLVLAVGQHQYNLGHRELPNVKIYKKPVDRKQLTSLRVVGSVLIVFLAFAALGFCIFMSIKLAQ